MPRLTRWGVVVAFVVMIAIFYAIKPAIFGHVTVWKNILDQASVPAIVAIGLTAVLVVGDFDLSIGAAIGLAMGISVTLMSLHGVAWPIAVAVALAAMVAIGLINGLLVTRLRVNSFIGTLAMSSVVAGVETKVTGEISISSGMPHGFVSLGANTFLGLGYSVWVAVVIGVLLYTVTAHTEGGRYMYAVGGNREAARLAGVRVHSLRTVGFIVAALCAGIGGVMLAANSASYYPNSGTGYLLPAFAAAFLGTALMRGRFTVPATIFGVLFLQTLATGLTVLNVQSWVVQVVQGAVLIVALVISGAGGFTLPRMGKRKAPRTVETTTT